MSAVTMRGLLAREASIRADLQAMNDAAGDGAMPDDLAAKWTELEAALTAVKAAIARQATLDDSERSATGRRISGSGDGQFDREVRSYSIARAIAGAANLDGVDWGREREISTEIARRARAEGRVIQGLAIPMGAMVRPVERRVETVTTPPYAGAALVQTVLDGSQYIDLLRTALQVRQLGARMLTGLTSNLDVPRLAQTAQSGWVAENSPLPISDEVFDKVSLRPKHAGAIVEFSRNMLLQSTPDVEQLIRADLAANLARVLDGAAIAGTGANYDPVGILNTPGIGNVAIGTNGGPLTWASVLALVAAVENQNVVDDHRAFLSNTRVKQSLMQTQRVPGVALGFVMEEPDKLAGYDFAVTNLVTNAGTKGTGTNLSTLIFGAFSELLIAVWSELDILVNPYAEQSFVKGNVQVRAMMTVDIAVRHPQSFAAITDIVTP